MMFLLAAACSKEGSGRFELGRLGSLASPDPAGTPTEYRLDSQPFSPSLPYLFDQARLIVLPEGAAPAPANGDETEPYAFTAVDRFGRCYHFDRRGRWSMAEGETVPAPLPPGGWDAAWNPEAECIELLITAPWAGRREVQVLRWREGMWSRLDLARAPLARTGAARCFLAGENRWIIAGGLREDNPLEEGWMTHGAQWAPWPGGESPSGPKLAEAGWLIDGPAESTPLLLTRAGAAWVRKGDSWKECGTLKPEGLVLARYIPAFQSYLFVWGHGRGRDQFLWRTEKELEGGAPASPVGLAQTALVRINDRDEGIWKDWGRAHAEKDAIGQTRETLTPGFQGTGEAAIKIALPDKDRVVRRSEIKIVELPPELATCRCEAAAWVPALKGLVVPSASPMGMDARREAFFPPEAAEAGATTATQPIDVLRNHYRFWIFREKTLDWLKPPFEIHPGIDYANAYETLDGRRRCLAWTMAGPGLLRYDFHEFHDRKVQWIYSPQLTLKTIPQLAMGPGEELFLCDPVVWGDPPELVVAGWCGHLGENIRIEKSSELNDDEAFTDLPGRGFMARIDALNPREWKVSTLPAAFSQGAELVAAPARGSLFLLGGKTFYPADYQGKKIYVPRSQNEVWQWDGENWKRISPQEGIQPRLKATTHVVYDPASGQLLSLTPRALYGFDGEMWRCLWQVPKDAQDWPDELALYMHPQSRLALGAWFMPRLTLRVWKGAAGWVPVKLAATTADGVTTTSDPSRLKVVKPGGILPNVAANMVPATRPDAFVSMDAAALNSMRMDAPRDRDRDRLWGAWWLRLQPANAGPIPYGKSELGREIPEGAPLEAEGAAANAVEAAEANPMTSSTKTADVPTSPPPAIQSLPVDTASQTTATVKTIESEDGKVVKKNQTGRLMDRLESLGER